MAEKLVGDGFDLLDFHGLAKRLCKKVEVLYIYIYIIYVYARKFMRRGTDNGKHIGNII